MTNEDARRKELQQTIQRLRPSRSEMIDMYRYPHSFPLSHLLLHPPSPYLTSSPTYPDHTHKHTHTHTHTLRHTHTHIYIHSHSHTYKHTIKPTPRHSHPATHTPPPTSRHTHYLTRPFSNEPPIIYFSLFLIHCDRRARAQYVWHSGCAVIGMDGKEVEVRALIHWLLHLHLLSIVVSPA